MKRTILIILLCILIALISVRIKNDWLRYRFLKEEVNKLILKNKRLTEEQEKLQRLKESGSQQEVLEEEVRVMMGLQKAGEHVVLVLPINDQPSSSTTLPATTTNQIQSFIVELSKFWYNLKTLFKGY